MELETRGAGPGGASVLTTETPADPVDTLLAETSRMSQPPALSGGVKLGTVVGWDDAGRPLVAFADNPTDEPLAALATVAVGAEDVGREAALLFVGGDPTRPLIVGLLQPPAARTPVAAAVGVEARVDGERIEFNAEREIVFRCGKSSITLTRAGKVLIEGAYLLSRSTGVNRIKGGAVQLN